MARLTIAVCTYRRFERLRRCLGALAAQTLDPEDFRILIVDNSLEPEKSEDFRRSIAGMGNLDYRVTARCGIGFARSEALRLCESELLAFTDDDCLPPPDWAERMLAAVDRHGEGVGVVGGRVLPDWEGERPPWLDDRFLAPLGMLDWGDEGMFLHHESGKWLLTANAVYRTEALRKAGGFPERLGRKRNLPLAQEEYAANDAISSLGFDMVYSPQFFVKHFVPVERVRQPVLCRDAFWDGVSQIIWRTGTLTSEEVDRLAAALLPIQERLIANFEVVATGDDLAQVTQSFRAEGWRAAAAVLGLDLSQPLNPPDRRPVMFVVTPCHNAAETINQTVLSVVSQAGRFSIRYHVQDGGSTDGTVEKLARWRDRIRSGEFPIACENVVFTYDSRPDNGMYSAIRAAFAAMSIPQNAYMTWINADDVLMQSALASVAGVGRDLGEAGNWIGQSPSVINERGEFTAWSPVAYPREIIAAGLCDGELWPYVQQEGAFWRKSVWDKVGGLNTALKRAGDWDLWRRFAQHGDLLQVPWMNGVFRRRGGQLSSQDGGAAYRAELDRVLPAAERRAAMKAIAAKGVEDVLCPLLHVDYDLEKYSLTWEPIADRLPASATSFISKASRSTGSTRSALEPPKMADAYAAALPPQHAPSLSLLQSSSFRRLYAASPALVQRGFRVIKFRGVLPLLDAVRTWRVKRALLRSGLFFPEYYRARHPEVAATGTNPLDHFIAHTFDAGHDPNPMFDCGWYLRRNPDVLALRVNPLYHFIKAGAREGRDPSPQFSVSDYCASYPELDVGRQNPLLHYFCFGVLEADVQAGGR